MTKYCPNCGAKIKEGGKFCGSCGARLEYVGTKTEKLFRRKNPWAAALLNFFLPAMGFVYLGGPVLILAGILVFVTDIVYTIFFWDKIFELPIALVGVVINIAWAVAGWLGAEYVNKERDFG